MLRHCWSPIVENSSLARMLAEGQRPTNPRLGCLSKFRGPPQSFDKLVEHWLNTRNSEENKPARLHQLCDVLGLQALDAHGLRYQVLHRTASALIEADDFGLPVAAMLVHSSDE